jgi:deoxyribose-phosphate aldolase
MDELASYIDYTYLKGVWGKKEREQFFLNAKKYRFAAVCLHPYFVSEASKELAGSSVNVCTVVGFPFGLQNSMVKAFETKIAVEQGADEIDVVMNVSAFREKEFSFVEEELLAIRKEAKDLILKVIIETCFLDQEEIKKAAQLCMNIGADFVKTSTGFGTYGAKEQDVALIRKEVGSKLGVKASGGIKTKQQAVELIRAGASRLGTSLALEIIGAL